MVHAVEVREVPPVRDLGEEQVALLPGSERPDLRLEPHRVGAVERHAEEGLLGAHLHLAHRHRHDELEVRPHRGAGVEVGGERHAPAGTWARPPSPAPASRMRRACATENTPSSQKTSTYSASRRSATAGSISLTT